MSTTTATPIGYEVIEFYGTGDAYFGGSARDLPLMNDGSFARGCYNLRDTARFSSKEEAEAAIVAAPNKRPGGKPAVVRIWR